MPFVGPAPGFANPPEAGQQAASPPAPAPSPETPSAPARRHAGAFAPPAPLADAPGAGPLVGVEAQQKVREAEEWRLRSCHRCAEWFSAGRGTIGARRSRRQSTSKRRPESVG